MLALEVFCSRRILPKRQQPLTKKSWLKDKAQGLGRKTIKESDRWAPKGQRAQPLVSNLMALSLLLHALQENGGLGQSEAVAV